MVPLYPCIWSIWVPVNRPDEAGGGISLLILPPFHNDHLHLHGCHHDVGGNLLPSLSATSCSSSSSSQSSPSPPRCTNDDEDDHDDEYDDDYDDDD